MINDCQVEDRRRRERENAAGLREAWTGNGRPPMDSQVVMVLIIVMVLVIVMVLIILLIIVMVLVIVML